MTLTELSAVIRGIAPVIREHIAGALQDLTDRLTAVEARALVPGPPGERGEPGEKGLDGQHGKDGRNGLDGKDGAQGIAGDPGRIGPQGERGEKGDPGERGPEGPAGAQGPAGERGEKGEVDSEVVRQFDVRLKALEDDGDAVSPDVLASTFGDLLQKELAS